MSMASPVLVLRHCGLPVLALLVLVLAGCEEKVAAVDPTGAPFEVYGVFNPTADTQWVRVFPIEGLLRASPGEALDARVVSTAFGSGAEVVWRDSLVAYPDGSYGYLYWAPFRMEGGRIYELRVERSDGATSRATVAVPALPNVVELSYQVPAALLAVFPGEDVLVRRFEVGYTVRYGWCPYEVETFTFGNSELLEQQPLRSSMRLEFGGAHTEVRSEIIKQGHFNPAYGLLLEEAAMHLAVTNPAWTSPDGTFDPELLIQPGTMTNVENGFGFVGGGYVLDRRMSLSDEMLQSVGYILDEPESPTSLDCTRGE